MNKVILMGRLTRDPEARYSQSANPIAVTRYGLAVRRQFTREGEPDVDFINIVSFGKAGEFAEKYFRKGQMVAVVGRLQVRTWDDAQGVKHTTTEVIAEEQHFAESKSSFESRGSDSFDRSVPPVKPAPPSGSVDGFMPIDERLSEDDDLPF
jgi:single-strand DNA-binding protein